MAGSASGQVLPGRKAAASMDGLTGGGSTFVYPAMGRWADRFKTATGVEVNYQSTGSGGGIRQFIAKTIDFGATDGPMSTEQIAEAGGGVLHIPVIMGAVAVTYNLPEVTVPLTLDGKVLADIFLGKITRWNDPAIAKLNEKLQLPDQEIIVIRRAEGSGTTYIFVDYLSKVSAEWKSRVGVGTSVNWPVGIAGKGNEGVSAQLTRTPYSIGYVELLYAIESKLATASLINADGKTVRASAASVTAAGATLKDLPDDLRVSITNAPGAEAYPISGIVWVVARAAGPAAQKQQTLKKFLTYVLSDEGQNVAAEKQYSKLPELLLEKSRAQVNKLQ